MKLRIQVEVSTGRHRLGVLNKTAIDPIKNCNTCQIRRSRRRRRRRRRNKTACIHSRKR